MSDVENFSDSDEARCINDYKEALKKTHDHADAAIEAARSARAVPAKARTVKFAAFRKVVAPPPAPIAKKPSGQHHGLNGTTHP